MANTSEGTGSGTSSRLPPPPTPRPGQYSTANNPPAQPVREQRALPEWLNVGGFAPPGVVQAAPAYQQLGGLAPADTVPAAEQSWENMGGLAKNRPRTTEELRADRYSKMSEGEQDAKLREQHVSAMSALGARPGRSYKMTWAEYNKLSPEQKAAVDWNTLLVRAVHKDKTSQDTYGEQRPAQDAAYRQTLEQVFGREDRGSKVFAPETMALLQQIGYHDETGDLDDFLQLKTGITTEDLLVLPENTGIGTVNSDGTGLAAISNKVTSAAAMGALGGYGNMLGMQRTLAAKTGEMEATLARGNQILGSVAAVAEQDRGQLVKAIGGDPLTQDQTGIGYQPPQWTTDPQTGRQEPADLNTAFQDTFDMLANPTYAKDHDRILAAFNSTVSPAEYDAFLNYANARSKTASQLGGLLGDPSVGEYIKPEEFRKMLGLTKGAPAADRPAPPATPAPAPTSGENSYG